MNFLLFDYKFSILKTILTLRKLHLTMETICQKYIFVSPTIAVNIKIYVGIILLFSIEIQFNRRLIVTEKKLLISKIYYMFYEAAHFEKKGKYNPCEGKNHFCFTYQHISHTPMPAQTRYSVNIL